MSVNKAKRRHLPGCLWKREAHRFFWNHLHSWWWLLQRQCYQQPERRVWWRELLERLNLQRALVSWLKIRQVWTSFVWFWWLAALYLPRRWNPLRLFTRSKTIHRGSHWSTRRNPQGILDWHPVHLSERARMQRSVDLHGQRQKLLLP